MKLSLEVDMDNAAFDGGLSSFELARIFTRLAAKCHDTSLEIDYLGEGEQPIRDSNGNKCGHWLITDMPEFIPGFHD